MWEWSKSDLEKLTVWRVKKNRLERKVYTADDLMNVSIAVDQVAYYFYFPTDDELANVAGFMSRKTMAALTGYPIARDLWPGADTPE